MNIDQLRKDPTVQYLGDAVYATHDGNMISLWTTDGIAIHNQVHLEPEVFEALKHYVERMHAAQASTLTRPGFACPHCGYRHPPDGVCVADCNDP